jgi:nucleoside-diphosphate-sugar epimerase
MRIAIFGATSQIAKDLILSFSKLDDHELTLFVRNAEIATQWLTSVDLVGCYPVKLYEDLETLPPFEALINFVGIGDPAKAIEMGASIFDVTYKYDEIALNYLRQNPNCRYLFLSSGAAYGSNFKKPVDENTKAEFLINHLHPSDWYGLAKLYAECRHRALSQFLIIDIRVFNYFSHTQDLTSRFLISDIVRAVKNQEVLQTNSENIVRDYLHPKDFHRLVSLLLLTNKNCSIDCYSKNPIDKFSLLSALGGKFGLRYEIIDENNLNYATGKKPFYLSLNHKASDFGYHPKYDSLGGICKEMDLLTYS